MLSKSGKNEQQILKSSMFTSFTMFAAINSPWLPLDIIFIHWLFVSGSTPSILKGLPKVHKIERPIMPTLSALDTFSFNLASLFCDLSTKQVRYHVFIVLLSFSV